MTVEEAIIWYNAKTDRWVFSVRALRRRRQGKKVRLEYSTPLPFVK